MLAILVLAVVTAAGLLTVGLLAARMLRELRRLDVQMARARDRAARRRRNGAGLVGPAAEGVASMAHRAP